MNTRRMLLILLAALPVLLLPVTLSGCNTMEGAGKDIESAGESIEDAADDNR